jgi:hypothetical protein
MTQVGAKTGKCPRCERVLQHVDIEPIDIHKDSKRAFHGVTFVCPDCRTILAVELDPIAVTADVVRVVMERMKKS